MSVNLYQTGVSGLLAAQKQLAVTGHNLANVNTEGYSRQRAEQLTTIPLVSGGNYFGTGTFVNDVTRIFNQFTHREQQLNNTNYNYAESLNFDLDALDSTMSYSGAAISGSIKGFYETLNSISDTPNDNGLRQMALTQASLIASDVQSVSSNLDLLVKSTNSELTNMATRITDIATEIAALNSDIQDIVANKGQPNDLLDTRDRLVNELSGYTTVSTVENDHGVISVLIGSGDTLVAGTNANSMTVVSGDPDPKKLQLGLTNKFGTSELNSASLGGKLQAKFEYRDVHIANAQNELDQLSMAIADTFNIAQSKGLDLNALQGKNLYTDINTAAAQQSRIFTYKDNTGTLNNGQIQIDDMSVLSADEYELSYDGINYTMQNSGTGEVFTFGPAGGGPFTPLDASGNPIGFTFDENGGLPAAGDKFLIRPTQNGAVNIDVTLTQPDGIAAATPVEVQASENNVSDGGIVVSDVYDPEAARLLTPMRVETLENPVGTWTYTVFDNTNTPVPGAIGAPYTPPSQLVDLPPLPAAPAFQIEIQGTPSGLAPNGPEIFHINDAFGEGNGGNALKMALTQETAIVNGRSTFNQALSETVAEVGSQASSAEATAKTAEILFEQSIARHQEISGVNLDEEAAALLQYQQAYQAASQVITTANTIFDTLLSAVR